MIRFLRYFKNPRIGLVNAVKLCLLLLGLKREVRLSRQGWYRQLALRPNHADWIAFDQIFIALSYGALDQVRPRRVIDAGANIGLSAVYFCERTGCSELVALEPETANHALAAENTAPYPQVQVLRGALWPRSANLRISNGDEAGSLGFQVEETGSGQEGAIRAYTVPEIMALRGWDRVDLLKIDIEGAEVELFSDPSVKDWISKVGTIVIELHDWIRPGCSQAFFNALGHVAHYETSLSGENLVVKILDGETP